MTAYLLNEVALCALVAAAFVGFKNRRWKAWKKCTVAKLLLLQEGQQ